MCVHGHSLCGLGGICGPRCWERRPAVASFGKCWIKFFILSSLQCIRFQTKMSSHPAWATAISVKPVHHPHKHAHSCMHTRTHTHKHTHEETDWVTQTVPTYRIPWNSQAWPACQRINHVPSPASTVSKTPQQSRGLLYFILPVRICCCSCSHVFVLAWGSSFLPGS